MLTVETLALEPAPFSGVSRAGSDPALIQYTSGSTGEPKGVLHTHANLLANITAIGAAIEEATRAVMHDGWMDSGDSATSPTASSSSPAGRRT